MKDLEVISEFKSSPNIKAKLLEFGITRTFHEGDVILDENDFISAIPIVLEGCIKVMRLDDDDHELLLYYISPGESCIMSFLGGIHQDSSKVKAVAEEDTEILFVPIEKVSVLIKEFPIFLDYIFHLYHKRFEELLEVVNGVAFKKMDERLSDYLKRKREVTGNNPINITHEQLASELGTARVVISRLLKHMEENGELKLSRNKITLL